MIYLASPYSHGEPGIRQARYRCAISWIAHFARQGAVIYSPIVHWHEAAVMHNLPTDFEFWRRQNDHMIAHAESIYVLCIAGWQESRGVTHEMQLAKKLHKPVKLWREDNEAGAQRIVGTWLDS